MKSKYRIIIYILTALLTANLVLLFLILFPMRSDVTTWSGGVIKLQKEIYDLSRQNRVLRNRINSLQEAQEQVIDFKNNRLGSRTLRLKSIMGTIDDLVYKFNLKRSRTTYHPVLVKGSELENLKIQFTVQGSYQSIRYFINSLERTPLFLILESLSLMNSDTPEMIQLNLGISTFFMKVL